MFGAALDFLADGLASPGRRQLGQHLPYDWIEQAVARTHAVSIGHRRKRDKCPELSEFRGAHAVTAIDPPAPSRVLLTALRERRRYRPAEIAAYYERRRRSATTYRELTQTMLEDSRRRVSGNLGELD